MVLEVTDGVLEVLWVVLVVIEGVLGMPQEVPMVIEGELRFVCSLKGF